MRIAWSRKAKDIRILSSQSECTWNAIHFVSLHLYEMLIHLISFASKTSGILMFSPRRSRKALKTVEIWKIGINSVRYVHERFKTICDKQQGKTNLHKNSQSSNLPSNTTTRTHNDRSCNLLASWQNYKYPGRAYWLCASCKLGWLLNKMQDSSPPSPSPGICFALTKGYHPKRQLYKLFTNQTILLYPLLTQHHSL